MLVGNADAVRRIIFVWVPAPPTLSLFSQVLSIQPSGVAAVVIEVEKFAEPAFVF